MLQLSIESQSLQWSNQSSAVNFPKFNSHKWPRQSAQTNHSKMLKAITALALYSLLGAVLFHQLEYRSLKPDASAVENDCKRMIAQVAAEFQAKQAAQKDQLKSALESAVSQCFASNSERLERRERWSLIDSLRYAMHVYSTIGFGNICPTTFLGRLATVVYGLAGIPLCSLVVSMLAAYWTQLLRSAIPGFDYGSYGYQTSVDFLAMLTYMSFGAVLFAIFERWSVIEAGYFSFVAISTIGFGDYVPDASNVLVEIVFTLGGQALIGLFFNRLTKYYEDFVLT